MHNAGNDRQSNFFDTSITTMRRCCPLSGLSFAHKAPVADNIKYSTKRRKSIVLYGTIILVELKCFVLRHLPVRDLMISSYQQLLTFQVVYIHIVTSCFKLASH